MDIYIARQPVFDRKMQIYGYELLYRKSHINSFEEADDDRATAEVLCNAFLVIGIDDLTSGSMAFINFSKELIESDIPLLLPKDKVVFEVLERSKATQATIDACARIRSLGYQVALDDFALDDDNIPLLGSVDILKIEYHGLSLDKQAMLLKRYKGKIRFLAEKIETREDYQKAYELGYDYFQGYFFSKPYMITSKEIKTLNITLFNIINELRSPDPSFDKLAEMISHDLGLSYKLLKLANSVYVGSRSKIRTVNRALTTLGTRELYQWASLMLIKDVQTLENAELIKLSLIRGKLMSLLADERKENGNTSDYFYTGIFSSIDILLNRPMEDILAGLPLSDAVEEALLGKDGDVRQMLDLIISFERADFRNMDALWEKYKISSERFMFLYVSALKWVNKMDD